MGGDNFQNSFFQLFINSDTKKKGKKKMKLLTNIAFSIFILMLVGSIELYSSEPISYWKFDERSGTTAYDSIGTNDGSLINGPTWVLGQVGSALDFDGVNDYINFGNVLG